MLAQPYQTKNIDTKSKTRSKAVKSIIEKLFESEVVTHIAHLQSKSYSEHMALCSYYGGVQDLIDSLAENSVVKTGILSGYRIMIGDTSDCCSYLNECLKFVETQREGIDEPYIQQMVDNIIEFLASTIYKLENLK